MLVIDHIEPVREGGQTTLLNLITACDPCNSGKGARKLADSAAVRAQMSQADALQERREQLEMIAAWKRELTNIDEEAVLHLSDFWHDVAPDHRLNEEGRATLRKWLRRFDLGLLMDAMRDAAAQRLERDGDGRVTAGSWCDAFEYVGRIASVEQRSKVNPFLKPALMIRGILRNQLAGRYCNQAEALSLLELALREGVVESDLRRLASSPRSWSVWQGTMAHWIDEVRAEQQAPAPVPIPATPPPTTLAESPVGLRLAELGRTLDQTGARFARPQCGCGAPLMWADVMVAEVAPDYIPVRLECANKHLSCLVIEADESTDEMGLSWATYPWDRWPGQEADEPPPRDGPPEPRRDVPYPEPPVPDEYG